MTTITIYQNKRNEHKYLEVHNDGHYHNLVKQYIESENGVKNYTGDKAFHRWRKDMLEELLEDYFCIKQEVIENENQDKSSQEEKVNKKLDEKIITEPFTNKPIVNPFEIEPPKEITEEQIQLLEQWIHVRESVSKPIQKSVKNSVQDLVGESAWKSVWDSVQCSVGNSTWELVWKPVRESVNELIYTYISSFFYIKKWEYIDHEPYQNPFQSAIDLWEMGLVASYDAKIWRLHGGKDGKVMYEMER